MERKKAKVIMLPTETSYIAIVKETGLPQLFDKLIVHSKNLRPAHLYITTDEEIKEGDWWIENEKYVLGNGMIPVKDRFNKKIIATTDPKLRSDRWNVKKHR